MQRRQINEERRKGIMRTAQEIRKEIEKVTEAKKKAFRKVDRCNNRLEELNIELQAVTEKEAEI